MTTQHALQTIKKYTAQAKTSERIAPPAYDPKRHYLDIATHLVAAERFAMRSSEKNRLLDSIFHGNAQRVFRALASC